MFTPVYPQTFVYISPHWAPKFKIPRNDTVALMLTPGRETALTFISYQGNKYTLKRYTIQGGNILSLMHCLTANALNTHS